MVLIYKKVFLHEKIKRLTSAQYNFLVEGFSSGIALSFSRRIRIFNNGLGTMSFATARGFGGDTTISEHFQTEKYRQQFYKIISYPLLLIVLILVIVGIRQFYCPN